jgi:hypothetical protein
MYVLFLIRMHVFFMGNLVWCHLKTSNLEKCHPKVQTLLNATPNQFSQIFAAIIHLLYYFNFKKKSLFVYNFSYFHLYPSLIYIQLAGSFFRYH